MKKSGIFVTLMASLMVLSGCIGGSNNNGTSNSTEEKVELPSFDKDAKITIKFWHTMSKDKLQPVLEQIIKDFNATEYGKNITVVHEQPGGYDEVRNKVITNVGVGPHATPHLAYCYPDHVALYKDNRQVVTLDDYIDNEEFGFTAEEKNGFDPGFYEEGRTLGDGKMYSLPFVKSTEVLYYDKTFFDKNNLTVPTTWDEMWEVCAQIRKIDPLSTPLGYDSEANWFITNAEQRGFLYTSSDTKFNGTELGVSGHFRFNNNGNKEFLNELKTNFQKGYFTTKGIYGDKYTSALYQMDASKGRAYMVIGSTGGATNQVRSDSETGIAMLPQAAEGKRVRKAAISQGPSICMLKKDNVQEQIAAWMFLKFLTTDIKSQVAFAKVSGYLPASQTAQQSQDYQTYLAGANGTKTGVAALAAKYATEQGKEGMYFASPAFVGSSYARDAAGSIVKDVLINGKTADEALKDAVKSCVDKLS